ncbi:MAG TPA: PKD domain-containing protein [Flavobacteriales bacterium]|nr:PKD domain-containing protein [Flavobacteriales bacterium]HIN38642.1 PKD domain-containing protein [Flavobacteriales bacterium]HIO67300.1 PKD domain-containing protein [Flavobacteriales bacterium]
MKTQIISFISISIFSLSAIAQDCSTGRYLDPVFTGFDKTADIQYGQNTSLTGSNENLFLDVFEPQGDTMPERPLIIWAHGGSFIGGSRTGTDVVPLAEDFAKMGYVTASMSYRLGMNGIPFPGPDSIDATETVIRAVHDARAAVRFFKKDYTENGNTYGIDTNNIFFGGVSAGGVMAVHLAYLDKESEMPTNYIDTSQAGLGGGIEGNSGNPGYRGNVKAIINSAGALRDTAWMEAGNTPVISFHGDADGTVPYGTDIIYMVGIFPIMMIDGSSSVHERAENLGMNHCFEPWPGQDHVPHVGSAAYYDTLVTMSKNFLYQFVCGGSSICSYTLDTAGCSMPTASFSYSATSLDVTFTNLSAFSGMATYTWDFGDGSGSSTQQDPSYIYNNSGTYNVCLTIADSCGSDLTCQPVMVIDSSGCPPPTASFSYDTTGTDVTFNDSSTVAGSATYTWDFGDGVGTSTSQDPSYTYASSGIYNVCLTIADSCGSDFNCQNITVINTSSTNIAESLANQTHGLDIYPNPSSNTAKIIIKASLNNDAKVELYDTFGKLVRTYQAVNSHEFNIEKNELANGLYFVNLISGKNRWSGKLIFE